MRSLDIENGIRELLIIFGFFSAPIFRASVSGHSFARFFGMLFFSQIDRGFRGDESKFASASGDGSLTILDAVITQELYEEGLGREFVSRVQRLRKKVRAFVGIFKQ